MLPLLATLPLVVAGDHVVQPGESIQAAIDAAVDGDRVLVLPGTYVESIDLGGKAIELLGKGGAERTTIFASLGPVVTLHSGEGPGTVIRGFTLTGGLNQQTPGGGVAGIPTTGAPARAVLEDCIVRRNSALTGGGIAGNLGVTRCSIVDNFAGVTYSGGPLGLGGGAYGALSMSQCLVTENRVNRGSGGGLVLTADAPSFVHDSVIASNSAYNIGGGIIVQAGATATITRTVIHGNQAVAACLGYCGPGDIAAFGAGVYAPGSTTTVEGCTVVDNEATWTGGAGALAVGGLYGTVVRDSIVRDNAGRELDVTMASYSNVEGGALGPGNLDVDPGFVDAAGGDFHLTSTSPCIDAGTPGRTDPDGSALDLGAFPYADLYAPRAAPGRTPGWSSLSSEAGGLHPLRIQLGPRAAGHFYLILGSTSGATPGVNLLGATLPLVRDRWFDFTLATSNGGALKHTFGVLDANGSATAGIEIPSCLLRATMAWHAALVIDPATRRAVATRAVPIRLE